MTWLNLIPAMSIRWLRDRVGICPYAHKVIFLELNLYSMYFPQPNSTTEDQATFESWNLSFNIFSSFHELQLLDLSLNGACLQDFDGLQRLTKLRHLNLNGNSLVGNNILESLGRLASLRVIIFCETSISGDLQAFRNLKNLRELLLRCNQLNGSIPVFLFELPSLEHLDLSGNIYTYGRTFFSIILGVSANLLSGEIPWEIGNLNDVKSLNLSHNLFTGQIPATFGNMSAIESLDLSNNKLRGSIPWQLTKLRWLEVFSVAYGNLSGCILSSGQFNSFSAESYVWATLTFTMYHRGTCALPRQSPWKKKLWRRHLTTRSLIYIISASSFVLAFWATVWFMFFHSFGQHMNM